MRVRRRRVAAAIGAAVLVAATAGCTGGRSGTGAIERPPGHASPSAVTPSSSPTPAAVALARRAAAHRPEATNLPVTPALRAQLRRAYVVAMRGVRPVEIDGPRRGTVYYARVARTHTYWAIAWFDPSPRATHRTQVAMQDGVAGGVFVRHEGGAWKATVRERGALPCRGDVPTAVFAAWQLPQADCGIA